MVYQRLKATLYARLARGYPSACTLCFSPNVASMDLCDACLQALPLIRSACYSCGLPLTEPMAGEVCGQCLKAGADVDYTLALYRYQEPISWLVHALKYQARLSNARLLSQLWLQQFAERIETQPDAIIPVPLHPKRLRQRGFNQALELAKPVAKYLGVPVYNRICERIVDTPQQTDLPAKKRRNNVRNAFALKADINIEKIALFDDVVTTGSTVNELARLFKKQGVKHIQVWSIARAG